jgi:hypothetical protein
MYAEVVQGHTKRTSLSDGTLNGDRFGQGAIDLQGGPRVLVDGVSTVNEPRAYAIYHQYLK